MCFLDFIGLQANQQSSKAKKTLKEFSTRYSSNFMQKYHDLNVIHFNENMSMTSKSNTMKFARCPGAFSASPISNSFSNRRKSIREWGIETVSFEFSSDDCLLASSPNTSSTDDKSDDDGVTGEDEDAMSDARATASPMDSFCTMCTSTFSYSHCNNCEESACSSKCSAEESCYCCVDRSLGRLVNF